MKVKSVTSKSTKQFIYKDDEGNNYTWKMLRDIAKKKGYIFERPYNRNVISFLSPLNMKVIEKFKPDIENYLNNLWKVR